MDREQTLDVVDTQAHDSCEQTMDVVVDTQAHDSCEQTKDVVDTPAHDRRDWPSIKDFQEPEKTLRWREVQRGTYKVLEIHEHGKGKYGPSVVLKLESMNGTTFFLCGRRLR